MTGPEEPEPSQASDDRAAIDPVAGPAEVDAAYVDAASKATPAPKEAAPPVTHPLVRTHPETGAKSLYIGMYCSHVVGMPEAEGRALLDELLVHATQDRFVYTHRWQPGDVVLWDNRCLLHRAVPNYAMGKSRRVLQRLVVKGSAVV